MNYLELYEEVFFKEDAVVDIVSTDAKKNIAIVEVDDVKLSIPNIKDDTTVSNFKDLLTNTIRKSTDPNLDSWKGGQIKFGNNLKGKENLTLKQLYPDFPEPIEFILRPGELDDKVDGVNIPHELWMNTKEALRR